MGKQHNDGMFKRVVTDGLRKQHTAGVAQGVYAMCKVILGMVTAESRTAEERLADVEAFCRRWAGTPLKKVSGGDNNE